MNRKVRNLFRYIILLLPFVLISLSIYRTGDIDSAVSLISSAYAEILENSIFDNLFVSLSYILPFNAFTILIFGTFVLYAYYEIVDIMFDVLMFLPRFLDKCMDNLGKERD